MEVTRASQPKTWVLKASVHCEGCKRKFKKILQTLPGVYDIDIEIKHQRVSVTGDVTPETLINKLAKAGKHAVLWPEKVDGNPGNSNQADSMNEKNVKTSTQESTSEDSPVPGKEITPPATKPETPVQDSAAGSDNAGGKVNESAGKSGGGEKVAKEVKVEEKKPETGPAGNHASPPVVEKKDEEAEKSGEDKKKKKKMKDSLKEPVQDQKPGATFRETSSSGTPYYYSPPAAAVYGVSYNTAHPPANSYTGSYYAVPPPSSYAYTYSGSEMQPPLSDFESHPRQPLDSFEMFSDENPNGCLVM